MGDNFEAMSATRAVCAGMRRLDLSEAAGAVLKACAAVPGGERARLWLNVDGQWLYRNADGKLLSASMAGQDFPPAVLDAGTGKRTRKGDVLFQPLAHNGRIVAVLELPEVGDKIIDLISPELLAVSIGVCLDAQSMQRSFLTSLERLARVLESRDPYANGHSDRVARYSAELARILGCSPEEIEQIYHAAVLHDLGKAGIAAGILEKPGTLTEHELNAVRQHPKTGADILSSLSFLGGVVDIVRSHHEWYNGDGYNDGLRATEIPLGARIVAAADAFEAMTADRPYRKAMPMSKVVERLRKGAGAQWDADVVEALLSIIASGPLD